jgi:hypothetical protein
MIIFVSLSTRFHLCPFVCLFALFTLHFIHLCYYVIFILCLFALFTLPLLHFIHLRSYVLFILCLVVCLIYITLAAFSTLMFFCPIYRLAVVDQNLFIL